MWHLLTLLDALEAESGGLSVAALLLLLPASGRWRLFLAAALRLLLLELLDPLPSLVVIVVIL